MEPNKTSGELLYPVPVSLTGSLFVQLLTEQQMVQYLITSYAVFLTTFTHSSGHPPGFYLIVDLAIQLAIHAKACVCIPRHVLWSQCVDFAACCRKEWVDVKGEYTDKGYVDNAQGVIGLPFLIAVVLGVFGALAYVVSQTSAVAKPPVG